MKITHEFCPGDRYTYDFGLCSYENGWAQVDTTQDASYFGTWDNPTRLMIFSYCEGDTTLKEAASPEEFAAELREIDSWNRANGYGPALGWPGLITLTMIRLASVSASDCARNPASVAGAVAPDCAAAFHDCQDCSPRQSPQRSLAAGDRAQAFPQHRDAGNPEQRPPRLPRCGGLGDPRCRIPYRVAPSAKPLQEAAMIIRREFYINGAWVAPATPRGCGAGRGGMSSSSASTMWAVPMDARGAGHLGEALDAGLYLFAGAGSGLCRWPSIEPLNRRSSNDHQPRHRPE
jgi:hypothetical protein